MSMQSVVWCCCEKADSVIHEDIEKSYCDSHAVGPKGGPWTEAAELCATEADEPVETDVIPHLPPIPEFKPDMMPKSISEQLASFVDLDLGSASAAFITYKPLTAAFHTRPFQLFVLVLCTNFFASGVPLLMQVPEVERFLQTADCFPTQWTSLFYGATCCATAVALLIGLVDARMHQRSSYLVKLIGILAAWFTVMICMICIVSAVHSEWLLVFHWCCQFVGVIQLPYAFLVNEAAWMICHLGFGSFLITACVVFFCFKQTVYEGTMGMYGVIFAGIGCIALFLRSRALKSAQKQVNIDRTGYDEVWNIVRTQQECQLRELARTVGKKRDNAKKLQPSRDAQMLYHLALCLGAWYQEVVQRWAAHLCVTAQSAPMKSPKRLMEKIFRSYRGRPEFVTDIIRSTIICETIDEVQRVLDFVMHNSNVHVIKNRFDVDYSGECTGGYRDVNMQLSFQDLEGTEFHGFVFELQIHLKDILARKHAEGHRRYVLLRNLKGE